MKDLGYLLSILSVFLIGYVAADSVAGKPVLALSLWLGVALSVIGMALRWASHRRAHRAEARYSALPAGE